MKDSVVNLLEDFEKLAYKLVLWIILIPKTVIKITLNPREMRDYVYQELDEKGSSFEKYISPLFLYLGVTLLPFVLLYFVPLFGVSLSHPASDSSLTYNVVNIPVESEQTAQYHFIEIRADADFKADTSVQYHQFDWELYGCRPLEDGSCKFDDLLRREIHNERLEAVATLKEVSRLPNDDDWNKDDYVDIELTDRNTVKDKFVDLYNPGIYFLKVTATNFKSDFRLPLEEYSADMYFYVDEESKTVNYLNNYEKKANEPIPFEKRLKSGGTIFSGFILLIPPLLLAYLLYFLQRRNEKVDQNDLKKNFYVQCYYFSPLGLAIWAWVYSIVFYTPDISPLVWRGIFIPPLLALVWFALVEIDLIVHSLSSKSKKTAIFVFLGYIAGIVLLIWTGLIVSSNYDILRNVAMLAYVIAAFLLACGALFPWAKKWWNDRRSGRDKIPPSDFQTPADG